MKIYVGRFNEWNYRKELYEPIMESNLYKEHEFIFSHNNNLNNNGYIEECDLLILDETYNIEDENSKTGNKKIVCIYMMGLEKLGYINTDIIEYRDSKDMIKKLEIYLNHMEEKEEDFYFNRCIDACKGAN